jgi:multidrug efflux pump subunit AcrA (membrane-fusion protein)
MDSLRFRQRTLEQRLANLEIRSPIDGVVIAGDASRHEGSRLTIGEALMEIGALDQMVVELSVDDDEINSVREGQDVRIRLDSHPRSKFKGQLNQLHPMAELRDGDNVFIAEVPLENPTAILRPGMRGHAKVNTGRRLLGWILFHRAWHQLLFRIGW